MWTPTQAIRGWVRRQAELSLNGQFDQVRKDAERELRRALQMWPADAVILGDDMVAGKLSAENVLVEHTFRKPTILGGYLDATSFLPGDSCAVTVFVEFAEKEELSALYDDIYTGPMKDCISLHEQPVLGRVKIVYTQLLGMPKPVFYRFYGRK